MAHDQVMDWFEKLDPDKTGMAPRTLVDSLLTVLLGANAPEAAFLEQLTNQETKKCDYKKFVHTVFGDYSDEGYRWKDKAWLGGAETSNFPQVDVPTDLGIQQPKLDGGFEQLIEAAPELQPQTVNHVKKCTCGKVCAVTMDTCNACGADLSQVDTSTTNNVFIGFIFGLKAFKISLRGETADMMVNDDQLTLTRAHVLAIPTDVYVPDIRSLFVHPAAGLKLIQKMEQAAWDALAAGPLKDPAWKNKALSAAGAKEGDEKLRARVIKAFNLPPSQYQIHLQYMLPPLLPSHFALWKKGAHFANGRHFPYKYVEAALQAFIKIEKALPDAPTMSPTVFVEAIKTEGVDYEAAYAEDMDALGKNNLYLANWKAEDFKYVVSGDTVQDRRTEETANTTRKEVDDADKLALQGHGRPFTAEGKPGGLFYKHARDPAKLAELS